MSDVSGSDLNFIERAKVVSAVKLGCLSPEDAAALRAERDALAAQVEALRKFANSWNPEDAASDPSFSDTFFDLMMETPAACLAQVKADAGRAGYLKCAVDFHTVIWLEAATPKADAYAERIRREYVGTWLKDSNVNGGRREGSTE